MAALTAEQLAFLERQNVPLSRVLDATGLSTKVMKARMRYHGHWVAFGTSPCHSGHQHTMKLRSGHCFQCNPKNLSYLKRSDGDGLVYVATSAHTGLTKIGTSSDPSGRVAALCREHYGGAYDWHLHTTFACAQAGRVEFHAHGTLAALRVVGLHYVKDDEVIECRELFRCAPEVAVEAVRDATALY